MLKCLSHPTRMATPNYFESSQRSSYARQIQRSPWFCSSSALCDRVDWYAQIANEEARTVHTVPAKANQKASPSLQESPRTKGWEFLPQYLSATCSDPQPAAYASIPRVNNMEANDWSVPQMVNTEQQMQRRQQIVKRAKRSVTTHTNKPSVKHRIAPRHACG